VTILVENFARRHKTPAFGRPTGKERIPGVFRKTARRSVFSRVPVHILGKNPRNPVFEEA